jgi:hypothetical protein
VARALAGEEIREPVIYVPTTLVTQAQRGGMTGAFVAPRPMHSLHPPPHKLRRRPALSDVRSTSGARSTR